MSYVVKGHSVSDTEKSPTCTVAGETDVILKNREIMSDKPEVHYHLSPAPSVINTAEETLPLYQTAIQQHWLNTLAHQIIGYYI